MSVSRRYEILLPLRFNDGQPVPDALIYAGQCQIPSGGLKSLRRYLTSENVPSLAVPALVL